MKNLKITVNGVAYNVQVEEVNGAAPVAAAPAAPAPPRLLLPLLPRHLPLALKLSLLPCPAPSCPSM